MSPEDSVLMQTPQHSLCDDQCLEYHHHHHYHHYHHHYHHHNHHPHLQPHGVHIKQQLVELCLCPELLQPQNRVGAQPGLLYISIW